MGETTFALPFDYDGYKWTSPQGALYALPPERSVKCFDRDLMGDCDLTQGMEIVRKHFPRTFVQFKGGMTFDGRPLWVCELGQLLVYANREPRPKFWIGEASDKASSLQKAIEEMVYWLRKRKYDIDNGMLLV